MMRNNGKNILLVIAPVILLCSNPLVVSAQLINETNLGKSQKISPAQEKANDLTKWMQKNLSLSLSQYSDISEWNDFFAKKEDSATSVMKDKHSLTVYISQLKQKKDQEFKTVLSDYQYKQYLEHKEAKPVLKRSPFSTTENIQ